MDYEKLYKEALEKAKKELRVCGFTNCDAARQIFRLFPELAESENKRIRKYIINHFQEHLDTCTRFISDGMFPPFSAEEIEMLQASIAWLERQDEQKSADKIEPKFKVGDYIERKDGLGCHAKIIFVGENVYGCEKLIYPEDSSPFFEFMFKNQDEFLMSPDFEQKPADEVKPKFKICDWIVNIITNNVEQIIEVTSNEYICSGNLIVSFDNQHLLRKWTVEDAKDGDILITVKDKAPFIFKGFIDKFHPNCPVAYGGITSENTFDISNGEGWWDDDDVKPANKEQRNLLFQKMREAGYVWDSRYKKFISF